VVVGMEKREKHDTHAANQLLGVFRHRSRAHEFAMSLHGACHGWVQCHNHVNHQDHRPKLSPRCASVLGSLTTHDDTAASMWSELECPLCGCKPAQLELHIIMDRLLHETYVK
jgi:hypothetical protein